MSGWRTVGSSTGRSMKTMSLLDPVSALIVWARCSTDVLDLRVLAPLPPPLDPTLEQGDGREEPERALTREPLDGAAQRLAPLGTHTSRCTCHSLPARRSSRLPGSRPVCHDSQNTTQTRSAARRGGGVPCARSRASRVASRTGPAGRSARPPPRRAGPDRGCRRPESTRCRGSARRGRRRCPAAESRRSRTVAERAARPARRGCSRRRRCGREPCGPVGCRSGNREADAARPAAPERGRRRCCCRRCPDARSSANGSPVPSAP